MAASVLRRLTQRGGATLAAGFILLAQQASAADFQLDGFKLDFGGLVISSPKIEVKGSTLEREAFATLLNGSTGESAVSRMSKLNAGEISAAEITFEQAIGAQKQVTRYRDVRFSDVKDGKVGRGSAASGTIAATLPASPGAAKPAPSAGGALGDAAKAIAGGAGSGPTAINGQLLRTSFEALDLKHMARVLTEKAQPGVTETMQPIFGRFEQDGYTLDMGAAGKLSLGKTTGRGFAAKVGDEPLGEVFTRLMAMSEAQAKAAKEPGAKPPSLKTEEDRRMGLSLLTLIDNFSYGSGEARDMVMSVTAPPKPGAKPETVDMKIARIAFGEDTPAKSGFAMEGFQFTGGGAKGLIDSISYSGFSIGPVVAELKALLAKPDADLDTLDFRKFIPTIGTMRFAGVSVDAPQEAKRGLPTPPPLKIGLGVFELKSGEQINGVPTSISLTIDNLLAPVVEGAGNPAARDLLAMGYKMLDLSAKVDLAWEAARNELAIRAISLGGAGMAKLDAKGTLGNVTKDLFSSDLALAQVAALGATARSVEAKLQNLGLFEKLLENEARKAKRKPEELRQQFAMMASLGLAAILGPSDAAKTLTAAISRFVAKPGTLSVQATAKSATGLGLADVITLTDPTEIFDKIDLKASSE